MYREEVICTSTAVEAVCDLARRMENEADENSLPSDEIIKEAVFQWLKNIDASKVTKKDLKQQVSKDLEFFSPLYEA